MPASGKSFEYRGDLAEKGLPEILYTIDRFQVAGVIEAEKDGVVKSVHIKDGRVIHAASSDLNDSLGTFLRRRGKLSEDLYSETMRIRGETERRYGEVLVEAGILAPLEVYEAIRQHLEAIVWSLFSWQQGAVLFSIGDFAPPNNRVRIELPMPQVILHGIKRAPNARALVSRLGKRETVFEPYWEHEYLIEAGLDKAEYELLQLVDGQRSLLEVCADGPFSAAENAKLMYGFYVLGLIEDSEVRKNQAAGAVEAAGAEEDGAEASAEAAPEEPSAAEPAAAAPPASSPPPGGDVKKKPVKIRLQTQGDRFAEPDD